MNSTTVKSVYLDYAATTPVDPRVATLLFDYLTTAGHFGNPSSLTHAFGLTAKQAVELSREQVASLLHAETSEIIFTSGATEAINLGLKGAAQLYQQKGKHIITVKTEHKAVLDTCQHLEKEGFTVTYLSPEKDGLLDLNKLRDAIREDTIIVAVMYVNNETGVIQAIPDIAEITAEKEILFFVDAAQAAGKIPIDVRSTPIDLLALTGHKIYGPKGIGALYVRKKPRVRVAPQIHGGGHEQGMRSGTLPTHQIVGLGEACRLARDEMQDDFQKVSALRQRLLEVFSQNKRVHINTSETSVYPGILNVCIDGLRAQKFMEEFPQVAVSSSSACLSKGVEPSYVLRAMGMSTEDALCSIRISFGRFTTRDDIDVMANIFK